MDSHLQCLLLLYSFCNLKKEISIIITNYNYYAKLFGFSSHVIRNDYAVSIALKQLMDFGEVDHCIIPWDIHTTRDSVKVKSFSENGIRLSDSHSTFNVNFDCHVLDKESLLHAC